MEKEKISRFDLEAAFKALDEIDIPKVRGIRPNRMDLKEAVVRADRTSALIEDYYDLNDPEDMQDAGEDRAAEIAKAKLARIEKIVDLDAESEDEIQPSYVGKTIIQCPQCMTLFYKDPADIEPSEDDPSIVNVAEICQHCGNDSGYTLIGKVAEETPEEAAAEIPTEEPAESEEKSSEETPEEEPAEENTEEDSEEELNLEPIEIPEEESEEKEETKESLNASELQKDSAKKSELASENTSKNLTLNEDSQNESLNEGVISDKILDHIASIGIKAASGADKEKALKLIQDQLDKAKVEYTAEDVLNVMNEFHTTLFGAIKHLTEYDSQNESLTERVSTYAKRPVYKYKVYGTDNNANVLEEVEGEFKVDEVKKIKADMKAVMDKNPAVEHVFAEKIDENGKEIPLDHLTISRHGIDYYALDDEDVDESFDEDAIEPDAAEVEEGLGSAVTGVVDGIASGIKSLFASDEAEKEDNKTPIVEAESNFGTLSKTDIDKLFNSKEFKTPISTSETDAYLAQESLKPKKAQYYEDLEFDEKSFNKAITEALNAKASFEATSCYLSSDGKKIIVEGLITDNNTCISKKTTFKFKFYDKQKVFYGLNENFKHLCTLKVKLAGDNLLTESFK